MYLVDFFKSVCRKSNIPQIIYLCINLLIISVFMVMFFGSTSPQAAAISFLFGIIIYTCSLAIALSDIGESILRLQTGCKEVTDERIKAYFEPIFNEVFEKARKKDPTISPDVKYYMSNDDFMNAFATGRKTVCITRGILECDPEQLKGVLAHEFGHLAHKDTDMLQVINVGNMLVTGIIMFVKVCIIITDIIVSIIGHVIGVDSGYITVALSKLSQAVSLLVVAGLSKLWSYIGFLLCMKTSRGNEFEADAFSTRLGYGDALAEFFNTYVSKNETGIFATISASHPDKDDRIANIRLVQNQMLLDTETNTSSVIESNEMKAGEIPVIESNEEDNVIPMPSFRKPIPMAAVADTKTTVPKKDPDTHFCKYCGTKVKNTEASGILGGEPRFTPQSNFSTIP